MLMLSLLKDQPPQRLHAAATELEAYAQELRRQAKTAEADAKAKRYHAERRAAHRHRMETARLKIMELIAGGTDRDQAIASAAQELDEDSASLRAYFASQATRHAKIQRTARNLEIYQLGERGMTRREIGEIYNLSEKQVSRITRTIRNNGGAPP